MKKDKLYIQSTELVNSEGPLLTITIIGTLVLLSFPCEGAGMVIELDHALEFLRGRRVITSPDGDLFDLSPKGMSRSMVNEKGLKMVIKKIIGKTPAKPESDIEE